MAYPEQLQPDTCKYRIGTNKVSGGQRIFSRVPTLSMAAVTGVATDGHSELWLDQPLKMVRQGDLLCHVHESVVVFLRRVGGTQYAVLKP